MKCQFESSCDSAPRCLHDHHRVLFNNADCSSDQLVPNSNSAAGILAILRNERARYRILTGVLTVLQNVRTGYGAHPCSCSFGTGVTSWMKGDGSVRLNIYLVLVKGEFQPRTGHEGPEGK